jgi:hypothetical protein
MRHDLGGGNADITVGAVQTGDAANFTDIRHEQCGDGQDAHASGTVTDGNGGNNYNYTFITNNTGLISAAS